MKISNTFNDIIEKLRKFWKKYGCINIQPIDSKVGAATFHPVTFIYALKSTPWKASYTQISRRPSDLRYSKYSNKVPIFHQYQVIIKPSPDDIQELYLKSLSKIGIDLKKNDIKFIEDNWNSPTLGATGVGWEVWLNGVEITQFTYFQQMGGIECKPIMVELAYGIERLAMHIQNVFNVDDIIFDKMGQNIIKYSDIHLKYEKELSLYLKNILNKDLILKQFNELESECNYIIKNNLPLIAFEYIIKLSHIFNLLDVKSYFSNIEKQNYILKIRKLSNKVAKFIKDEKE